MQRSSSATSISSLLEQSQQPQAQYTQQRPMSYHHDNERSHTMHQSGLSALLPPLVGGAGAQQDFHDQRTELPRPYKCPLCDKAFHRLEHQTRHIRTHTGEKPHACSYPGCTKRFSRSDELTRHSRIHTNPNSRRSNKNQQAAALAAAAQNAQLDHATARMMPPPPKIISRSAPASHVGSPNVSPPHSYQGMHTPAVHSGLSPFSQQSRATSTPQLGQAFDLSMLAHTASQQLEREYHPRHHHYPNSRYHHPTLPPLTPMSRSHSHEEEDPYLMHRSAKKSRPSSPISTAPSSPTFSHDSCSPTPESTPLATPAHSPRLFPRELDHFSMQLPSIRSLSLRHMPALAPMEVADPYAVPGGHPLSITSTPPQPVRLGDIINRPDGAQRKLPIPPVPRVAVHDLLNGGSYSNSSSTANSIAGGDLAERI